MNLYAGLDLHSSNTYIGVLDQQFNRIFKKRVYFEPSLVKKQIGITRSNVSIRAIAYFFRFPAARKATGS
jgi:hypothetical protein